jgi:hypothetical protein
MSRTRNRRLPLALPALALVGLAPSVVAQEIRLGAEFQVNTHTASAQYMPAVAAAADGDFVVTWEGDDRDGSGLGVFARRFSRAGDALASELQVNSRTAFTQARPSVAMAAGGDLVVAWVSYEQDGTGSEGGVFARRFSSVGAALASEFQVNVYTTFSQSFPAVAAAADGDFIIAWSSIAQDGSGSGIFARRYSSGGDSLASEFQVNTRTAGSQTAPKVAADADGAFVVVWSGPDGEYNGVFARRFSSAGAAIGSDFQVNTYTTDRQLSPAVTQDADGDFVVVWSSYQDGSQYGVFARRHSSAGAALASEFQVNSYTTSFQFNTAVAAGPEGDFLVVWQSFSQDGSSNSVFARHFSSTGAALDSEFRVNSYTPGQQRFPAVATDGNRHFVVAWQSEGQDGSSDGVFAQRLSGPIILDIDGNGSLGALTDGLLVLRHLFGFTGSILVSGAIDLAGCTRCDAASIEAYLESLS